MRKSKASPTPPPFVYVRDVLPDVARALAAQFRRIGEKSLAESIPDLRIYGRCCEASPCGRFYCLPPVERRRFDGKGLAHSIGDVMVAEGRILEVETGSDDVDTILLSIFPEAENPDGRDSMAGRH